MRCWPLIGRLAGVLGALVWLGLSASAQAQDLAVVALGGNADETLRGPALDAVAARFTADGFAVLGPSELVHRVPPSQLALSSTDDAARLAASLGIPRVACVSVWASGEAITELSLSLHALSGERSVRHTSASGTLDASHDLAAVIDAMVAQVLAAERAAAMLDPGAGVATSGSSSTGSTGSSSTGSTGSSSTGSTGSSSTGSTGSSAGTGSGSTGSSSGAGAAGSGGDGPEPLFGVLGPGLLAAVGAAGVGLGIWASLDSTCDRYSADRSVCLRGESQNLGAGIPMIIGGAAALAGAIVWWITDAATPEPEPRIDVVIGPGHLGLRGTF
ncbi:MAG: hypothetical protein U0353_28375 [Sandaracinus sp.]